MKFTADNLRLYHVGEGKFALAYSNDDGAKYWFVSSFDPVDLTPVKDLAITMPYENAIHALRYLFGVPQHTDQRTLFINLMTAWYDSFDFITDDILKVVGYVTRDNIVNRYHDPSAVLFDYIIAGWNEDDLKAFNIYELLHSEVNEEGELEYEQ